ncbi:hypothetical protein OUZ56_007434 [Daphnia magna]|uniref:Membrane protein BRI3 n=1 Tax=Daphnia magna TaxID=35525 RepID=A0ABR0A9Y1_9CRUS|nr:hypothetical protein OUZ56_007434 [Daphnia magna]
MEKGNPPPYTPSAPPPGFIIPDEQKCYTALPVTDPAPIVVNVGTQQAAPQVIIMGGGCPKCHVGSIHTSHITCCGILWAILLFPFGLLCLLCCTKKRCTNCSYTD